MKKKKECRLLWVLLAEAVMFFFWLTIAPRLNFEGILYQSAKPVSAKEVLTGDEESTSGLLQRAGYPCTEPTGYMMSAADLQKNYIGAWEADASMFKATGIYKQINHRSRPSTQRGYYGSRSRTYGITAPAITRSWWTTFWMRPYADYAQYYLITFKDGSRTWTLVDNAITRIPARGRVVLPVGYYWDEGAARFLNEKEKKAYRITDRDVPEDIYLGNALDLYSGWIEGEEMEQYYGFSSFIQSVAVVITGCLLFITLILFMFSDRKSRRQKHNK